MTISVKTVERHRSNILEKLGMRDRTELPTYAIRVGLSNHRHPPGAAIAPRSPKPTARAATPTSVSPQSLLPGVIRTRRLKVVPSRTITTPRHRSRMPSAGLMKTKFASEPCDTVLPCTNSTR